MRWFKSQFGYSLAVQSGAIYEASVSFHLSVIGVNNFYLIVL